MGIKVNQKTCIGCGACESACPEVFEVVESKAKVKPGKESSDSACVQEAIDICPVKAISK